MNAKKKAIKLKWPEFIKDCINKGIKIDVIMEKGVDAEDSKNKRYEFGDRTNALIVKLYSNFLKECYPDIEVYLTSKWLKDNYPDKVWFLYKSFDLYGGDAVVVFSDGTEIRIDFKCKDSIDSIVGSISCGSITSFGTKEFLKYDSYKYSKIKELHDEIGYVHEPDNHIYICIDPMNLRNCVVVDPNALFRNREAMKQYNHYKEYFTQYETKIGYPTYDDAQHDREGLPFKKRITPGWKELLIEDEEIYKIEA